MKFQNVRSLVDQVFSTKVQFVGYGDDTDQSEANAIAEQDLITNFGAPTIDLGLIQFKGGVKVDVASGSLLYDEAATESVSFVVNSLKVEVKDGFEVSYSCNSKRVDPAEYPNTNTILNTAQKVAEAKCIVFEEKIKAAVATAIANLKAGKTKFDDVQSAFVI